MKTITDFKTAKVYSLTTIYGFMTSLIQIEKSFFQTHVIIFDGIFSLGFLFSYLFKLFLKEHLDDKALVTNLFHLYIRLDEMDCAFMAVIVLSLVGAFKYTSLLGMVGAGKDTEACLFQHALHKLSINKDRIQPLFCRMSLINALFWPIPIRIMRAIIAHLLDRPRSGHSRYNILLILHSFGYPAIKGVLVEIGLHLADHGGRSLIHIF